MENVRIAIVKQGSPIVNHGVVVERSDRIVAISVDMRSKYCVVSATGGTDDAPSVSIAANESASLYLNKGVPIDQETTIEFPDFPGYTVWCANIGRYSLSICLVKSD